MKSNLRLTFSYSFYTLFYTYTLSRVYGGQSLKMIRPGCQASTRPRLQIGTLFIPYRFCSDILCVITVHLKCGSEKTSILRIEDS